MIRASLLSAVTIGLSLSGVVPVPALAQGQFVTKEYSVTPPSGAAVAVPNRYGTATIVPTDTGSTTERTFLDLPSGRVEIGRTTTQNPVPTLPPPAASGYSYGGHSRRSGGGHR